MSAAEAPARAATALLVRRARRHGAADLALALLYGWLGFAAAPSRAPAFTLALTVVIGAQVIAGVMLLSAHRSAWWVALAAQSLVLAFCAAVVALLVLSAAYLRGVYGAVGEGLAALAWIACALVVEACAILPLLQIGFLLRPEVRRALGSHAAGAHSEAAG